MSPSTPQPGDQTRTPAGPADLSLAHLVAELVRIDILLHREVRRWQLAGQNPNDPFRGQYVSDAQAAGLVKRPFSTNWGDAVQLQPEERQSYGKALAKADAHVQAVVELAEAQGQPLRLARLAAGFGLDRFELDVLLVCLASALDLRYERIYGYLQDDVTRRRPSINLMLDLLCEPGPERLATLSCFSNEAPLFRFHLLERVAEHGAGSVPLLRQMLAVDEALVAWLLGRYQPHADLDSHVTLLRPQEDSVDRLLAAPVAAALDEVPLVGKGGGQEGGGPPILAFHGPDRAAQRAAARTLAARVGRSLLLVDVGAIVEGDVSPARAVDLALRDACLTGAIPYLDVTGSGLIRDDYSLSRQVLARLCGFPDLAIVAGPTRWQPAGVDRQRRLFWLRFPIPPYQQRLALWHHFLGSRVTGGENDLDLEGLAGQFLLTSGQIRDVVASARDRAAQRDGLLVRHDLFAAARAHSNPRLVQLARKIAPRYTWDDIVLPDDQLAILREIVATVRSRPLVLDEWAVGHKLASSAGITILFAGPPGTGKTMAAEVIADELGLDLYKIDLSTVVSKYIGETEKNLERIFKEAEHSNAILFFDEADSLFGKRSEVRDSHDRYANIEISYLLQRMEAYDGVTILATNLRANLDEAFTRRLQFAVDFPFPEEEYRVRIWTALFPSTVPCRADVDFDLLARRFKLAGGNIRNVIVSAAYLAASDGHEVTMAHLLHGTRRELQKMGRLVNESDMVVE